MRLWNQHSAPKWSACVSVHLSPIKLHRFATISILRNVQSTWKWGEREREWGHRWAFCPQPPSQSKRQEHTKGVAGFAPAQHIIWRVPNVAAVATCLFAALTFLLTRHYIIILIGHINLSSRGGAQTFHTGLFAIVWFMRARALRERHIYTLASLARTHNQHTRVQSLVCSTAPAAQRIHLASSISPSSRLHRLPTTAVASDEAAIVASWGTCSSSASKRKNSNN